MAGDMIRWSSSCITVVAEANIRTAPDVICRNHGHYTTTPLSHRAGQSRSIRKRSRSSDHLALINVTCFGLAAAAAAGVRAGYPTMLQSPYGLSPGYVYGAPGYAVSGVGGGVSAGAGGLVQLPPLQHAAAVAAANHLYEYQAAAAQGAAAYQQQYAAAGFDPYATAAAAAAAASGAGYMSPYYALPGGGVQAPLLPPLPYPPQLQEARMQ
ncbi:hypothetical protein RR46_07333 [Papilio xuthus]|uniref:Uncharacterized protein n=1 Tax=Papilio xuthus TaxID=66420 RepID=A0A194PW31_PAPXU|nr:hypothetical protein RR46_07333 [Papilio xuthus]